MPFPFRVLDYGTVGSAEHRARTMASAKQIGAMLTHRCENSAGRALERDGHRWWLCQCGRRTWLSAAPGNEGALEPRHALIEVKTTRSSEHFVDGWVMDNAADEEHRRVVNGMLAEINAPRQSRLEAALTLLGWWLAMGMAMGATWMLVRHG